MSVEDRDMLLFAVGLILLVLVCGLWGRSNQVSAEMAEKGTQQWDIRLPSKPGSLTVVDTNGVCLYLYRGSWSADAGAAVAAVPKTQLPAGTGCQ